MWKGVSVTTMKMDKMPDCDMVCLVTEDEHETIMAIVRSKMRAGTEGFDALKEATISILGRETWDGFHGHVVGYRIVDEVTLPRLRPFK